MNKFLRYKRTMINLNSVHRFNYGYSAHNKKWWISIITGLTNSASYIAYYSTQKMCIKEFNEINLWISSSDNNTHLVNGDRDE